MIIKEHRPRGGSTESRCIIRTDTYSSTIAFFMRLFEEAQRDFPGLDPKEVEVVHYAGRRYAGTFGVEFVALTSNVPASYQEIAEVELKR